MKTKDEANENVTSYAAPALDKGLDILELLCRTTRPISQKEIAKSINRSVGELYRMLNCLVRRDYVSQIDDTYVLSTKLFQMAHTNPPTHRLLVEAQPIMDKLAIDLDQSCHLSVWNSGKQVVVAKVDVPGMMGFSVRVGSDLDAVISASGRVLMAFQTDRVRAARLAQALERRPLQNDPEIEAKLKRIRKRGYESARSVQVRGLHAVAFPILDFEGHALAALTVPYAERIDQDERKSIDEVIHALGEATNLLTQRLGGHVTIDEG